ncbi:MAG TPA: tetratricopeptide repeat protein, partial [Burkholderiaceae bacterium]|nr:tetratricopeptide repeat protein [Burkholderiaceae bacterium]
MGDLLRKELASPTSETGLLVEAAYSALQQVPGSLVCAGRVCSLLGVMNHYYRAARPEAGLAPAHDAVAIARELGDPIWLCKALKCLAMILADTRDIPSAIKCCAEAIEIARQLNDVTQESALWLNAGVANYYSAHYADAVACYQKAIELAADRPDTQGIRQSALSNIAVAALHLGDVGRGLNAIRQVIHESEVPESAAELLMQAHHEHHYTRLLLEVGLVEQARARAQLAKDAAARSHSPRAD